MSRLISLIVLLAIAVLVGAVFYKVMASFILPMFLAVILVVVFGPLHQWFLQRCQGKRTPAAGLTTAAILLIVLIPTGVVVTQAAREAARFARNIATSGSASERLSVENVIKRVAEELEIWNIEITPKQQIEWTETIKNKAEEFGIVAAGAGLKGLVGFFIMIVCLFFFLLDGPAMVTSIMHVFPLDDAHQTELVDRFVSVSRAIVTATLLAAVIQGLLAGAAFAVVGMRPVFLLMSLTMLLAMVPFVGAVSVWLPCCFWLYFHDHNTAGAIGLALFGGIVISQVDNIIKPWVLHGQSKLHPLLALLSVLGGVQALGPIGILVGPMAVAFLQTLLNMVQTELARIDRPATAVPVENVAAVPKQPPLSQSLRPLLHRIRMWGRRP